MIALSACGGDDNPLRPLELAIAAARSGDPTRLIELCDPDGRADADARRICAARPDDARGWAMFRTWFGNARILGLASGADQSDDELRIAVTIGPDERRVEATVVRRGGRWYLLRL